jgi:rubrerythrin
MLMESPLTKRVFVVTSYKDKGNGIFEAHQKYNVTEQFDALAEQRSGTCEIESEFWHDHGGDESDTYEFVLSCGHSVEWLDSEPPSFCPSCGARIRKAVLQCDR